MVVISANTCTRILTVRKLHPADELKVAISWERLALLDQIPRGIEALFFNVMSDSGWNIPAEDISQIAKKWTPQLLSLIHI